MSDNDIPLTAAPDPSVPFSIVLNDNTGPGTFYQANDDLLQIVLVITDRVEDVSNRCNASTISPELEVLDEWCWGSLIFLCKAIAPSCTTFTIECTWYEGRTAFLTFALAL
ncbi:hypothetical protein AB1N83_010570 [Pleurotus pulmonarius]